MIKLVILLLMLLLVYVYVQRIFRPREDRPYQFSEQQVQDYHASTACTMDDYDNQLNDEFFGKNSLILDVGCGDGQITSRIAQRHPDCTVLGVDASSEMML